MASPALALRTSGTSMSRRRPDERFPAPAEVRADSSVPSEFVRAGGSGGRRRRLQAKAPMRQRLHSPRLTERNERRCRSSGRTELPVAAGRRCQGKISLEGFEHQYNAPSEGADFQLEAAVPGGAAIALVRSLRPEDGRRRICSPFDRFHTQHVQPAHDRLILGDGCQVQDLPTARRQRRPGALITLASSSLGLR
jgi:hypothetical protein